MNHCTNTYVAICTKIKIKVVASQWVWVGLASREEMPSPVTCDSLCAALPDLMKFHKIY